MPKSQKYTFTDTYLVKSQKGVKCMANSCEYTMYIRGNKTNIEEFIKALAYDKSAREVIGRGSNIIKTRVSDDPTKMSYVRANTACAIEYSMNDDVFNIRENPDNWARSTDKLPLTLEEACRAFHVNIEVFALDDEICQAEHYKFENGIEHYERQGCSRHYTYEYSDREEMERDLGVSISENMYNSGVIYISDYDESKRDIAPVLDAFFETPENNNYIIAYEYALSHSQNDRYSFCMNTGKEHTLTDNDKFVHLYTELLAEEYKLKAQLEGFSEYDVEHFSVPEGINVQSQRDLVHKAVLEREGVFQDMKPAEKKVYLDLEKSKVETLKEDLERLQLTHQKPEHTISMNI